MRVIAASEVSGPMACSEKLLKRYLQDYITPPRRVDALILQSLLGGSLLLPKLVSRCGLYLAADYPCIDTNMRMLNSVKLHAQLPKPLDFVNSVSNAAGFYVAQKLGLEGPNLFIGAGPERWQKLCQLASVDLADNSCSQALLIVCDNTADFVVRAVLIDQHPGQLDSRSFANLCAEVELQRLQLTANEALSPA